MVRASSADPGTFGPLDLERIRRVVTGFDDDGRSTIERDDRGRSVQLGETIRYTEVWPPAAAGGDAGTIEPQPGGMSFRICELRSDPDAAGRPDGDPAGMHATATTDFLLILSGRLTMTLGDGSQLDLSPGDTVVQRCTEHAWTVPGPEPCQLLIAMVAEAPR